MLPGPLFVGTPEFWCRLAFVTNSKPSSSEVRTEVTVLLTNDQTARLDEAAAAIRRGSGKAISRSAIMRAIVTAAVACFPAWVACQSEDEICQTLLTQLLRGHRG